MLENIKNLSVETKTDYINNVVELFSDYIKNAKVEKKKFGEVMTPIPLVEEMLDTLPKEVWSNPSLKWLDPCNGVGTFPVVVIKNLMIGLEKHFPNEEERYKHILENMIYVCELQEKNMIMFNNIFNSNNEYRLNFFLGSFLENEFDNHMKEIWDINSFDIIIMNSPYQTPSEGTHNRSRPLYNLFIEKAINISNIILSIHPSRWMGKSIGLEEFRNNMFNRNDIRLIRTFNFKNKKNIFGQLVELRGGLQYFIIDKTYKGLVDFDGEICALNEFDIFVDSKYHHLIKRFSLDRNSLSDICESNSIFMNFNNSKLEDEPKDGFLPCYVSQRKGNVMYINKNDLLNKGRKVVDNWKVFTPFASGYGTKFNYFGNKIIGKPGEVCSNTYLTLLVESEDEAKSLISYMNTKFCNFFLSLRKNTQNMNKKTLKWIPAVPLDREWTDQGVFEYFEVKSDEKEIILGNL